MDIFREKQDGIMNENSSPREVSPEFSTDTKLTTADLAGAGRVAPPAAKVDSLVETDVRRAEIRGGAVAASGTNMPGTYGTATARAVEEETGPLFAGTEANELRSRWDAIQVGFVDEPRGAVEQADNLVAGTMKRLAEVFSAERSKLEGQWDQGENVSTEDLRLALRRYRSFFARLLAI
jgi:hypothetical protein